MTPRILPLSYRKMAKLLHGQGFRATRQNGGHVRWEHPDGRATVVPHHSREMIDGSLVATILKEAGLDPDDFRR